jgi:hypothetical protein
MRTHKYKVVYAVRSRTALANVAACGSKQTDNFHFYEASTAQKSCMQKSDSGRRGRGVFRQWFGKAFLLPFTILIVLAGMAGAQKTISQEYQVKALFLFNFTQFVDWPAAAFTDSDTPLVIGILGQDPFGAYLDDLIAGEKVNGHPLIVRRFASAHESKACQVLFINLPSRDAIREAISDLNDQSILTVSDASDFTRLGGMIQFFIKENKIRLRIRLEPATAADLVISSKLLRLAEIDAHKK